MSRFTLLAAALLVSTSVMAAEPGREYHIPASSVQPKAVAEWEAGATANIANDADVKKAPAGASHYTERAYVFDSGSVRILDFEKNSPVFHKVTNETALRVMKGSIEIDMDGTKTKLNEGDIVQTPKGALRGAASPNGTQLLLWKTTSRVPNPKTSIIRADAAKPTLSAEWEENGKSVRAATPEDLAKAPKDAMRLTVMRYELDGNSVRVVTSVNKGVSSTTSGKIDGIGYITFGNAILVENGKEYPLGPGDVFRQVGGATHNWKRSGDVQFVSTSTMPTDGKERPIPAGVREDAR